MHYGTAALIVLTLRTITKTLLAQSTPIADPYLSYGVPLAKTVTHASLSTNATAPNLPGPGRLLGLLLDRLGKGLESSVNQGAGRLGMGPEAVAREIRQLRRHETMTIGERYSSSRGPLSKREARTLKQRCEKLLKYATS